MMKFFCILMMFGFLSGATLLAEDVAYVASLTGVHCDDCKKTIARSLAKIEGVKVIKIEKNKDGTHTMTVTTDGTQAISMEKAVEAIKHVEHYQIKDWKLAKE
jgi:copper chaperone CopZ